MESVLCFLILLNHCVFSLQLLVGHNPHSGNHFRRPPSDDAMHVPLNVAVQLANAQSPVNNVRVSPCVSYPVHTKTLCGAYGTLL